MSLKKIIKKLIASLGAISIVFGNCSLCGIGLAQVIAEDLISPAINIELVNEKYVQYQYNKLVEVEEQEIEKEIKGVAVQSKLSVYPEYKEDTYLPTENVEINFNLPVMNGYLPEKATVVEAKTKSTTGKEIDENVNQNYDSNSGLLTISYINIPDENGNIYSAYNENAKDEFEIIYIYPTEAYVGNEEEINMQSSVAVQMAFRTETGSVVTENIQGFELTEKDNKGDITTFGLTELEGNVYKGFMYANVENKKSYDTEINTVSTFAVLNSSIIDENIIELKDAEFILNDEDRTRISTNGNVVYKSTQISKAEFDKILGQEGSLEIYSGETLIAVVNYTERNENENIVKKLAVKYSDEDTRILSDDETKISIEYKENVSNLKIKMSKPVTEGFMYFENKNLIKASEDYGCDISEIKQLSIQGMVNEYVVDKKIKLLEPETKISVESSNVSFSTLQTNKTTLTIKLDNTNASTKLFNNPTIVVELPKGFKSGIVSSPEIVNGNGLMIENVSGKSNKITIKLKGKQVDYDLNSVSGGTSIVMDIENIDYKDTLPTHSDKIIATCIQGNESIETIRNVNIVSKSGLLVLSKVSGFDDNNTVIRTIDNGLKNANIEKDAAAKEIVQTVDLVNNYDDKISNVEIIGRLGHISEQLNSNFDLEFVKEIEIEKGKVYYSINKDATYEDDSWTEEFTKEAKAYKVEISNKELAAQGNVGMKLYLNIPANLYYNQRSYIKTEVNYTYKNNNMSDSSVIGMVTPENNLANNSSEYSVQLMSEEGEGIPVNVIITPNITQNYVHSRQRVTYNISVTNNGREDLNNVVVEDIIPNNAIYTYLTRVEGIMADFNEIATDAELKNKTWNIETLKAGQTEIFEIMLTMADVTEEQEIENTVVLKHNDQTITSNNKLTLKPAIIETSLITNSEGKIGIVYNTGNELQYYINVKNISDNKVRNIQVQYQIPTSLIFKEGGLAEGDFVKGYTIVNQGNISNNIFEYNIESLDSYEEKVVCVKVKVNKLADRYESDITTIANVIAANEIFESNIKTIHTKQSDYTIKLKSNKNEDTILKFGDKVIYTVEVENIGAVSGGVKIIDNIPEQLDVKRIEEYVDGELKQAIDNPTNNIEWIMSLEQGEKGILKIISEVRKIEVEEIENIELINKASIDYGAIKKDSNEIKSIMKPELKKVEEKEQFVPSGTVDTSNNNQRPEDKPSTDNNGNTEQPKLYSISGMVWLDVDKDGRNTVDDKVASNIQVSLIDMATGNFAKDANGNNIITKTNEQGKYEFNNLVNGVYTIMFEFDTQVYTVTTYQKEGVSEKENSDAILSTTSINVANRVVALTDKLQVNSNKENIDLGLVENPVFDLSLDKKITEITVIDNEGTDNYQYEDGHTAKVDLVAKHMNGANVIVNYKFTITNEGEVTGYVDSLMDSLPSGLEFSSELNKEWYKDTDGNLYTNALSGKAIKSGESIEIDLVLTKTMTEDNAGTFVNSAKLEKISNLENIYEKEDVKENNESSAILIISIKTGSAILYIGITILCLAIIGIGVYYIKKKVLMRII